MMRHNTITEYIPPNGTGWPFSKRLAWKVIDMPDDYVEWETIELRKRAKLSPRAKRRKRLAALVYGRRRERAKLRKECYRMLQELAS